MVVIVLLRGQAAEYRHAGTHHVHRVGGRRQLLQGGHHCRRQAAQGFQLGLVGSQFRLGRQFAMYQQVGDFLELTSGSNIQNVVTTVVQVITAATHGTERGITGCSAAQSNGLLRLESRGGRFVGAHGVLLTWTRSGAYCLCNVTSCQRQTARRACFRRRGSRYGHTARHESACCRLHSADGLRYEWRCRHSQRPCSQRGRPTGGTAE